MQCGFGLYNPTSFLQAEGRTVQVAPPPQPYASYTPKFYAKLLDYRIVLSE